MNGYQMFRKIQERDNIIKKYSNDTKEDLIDLVIEKDNIIDNLQFKIDKANEIINKLCVYKPYGYENANARPIKNTTKQEVYNAIYDLRDILQEDK